MKTIILCGGLGYRLKEETEFKPKPMVNVGGRPILWHIMKIYAHYGFNDFILALGYKSNHIKDYFLNQKYFAHDFSLNTKTGFTKIFKNNEKLIDDFKITFVDTGESTLPGERILKLQKYIPEEDDNFMVTYGDGVSDININELVKFHKEKGKIGTITGVHPNSKFGLLNGNGEGMVKKFMEKPSLAQWVNGGFMVFNKEFFKYLREGELEHPALKRLVDKEQLALFTHEGFWHCMDTYNDVDALNKIWQEDPKWKNWE